MFTVPDLPYAYNALEPHIDERTMMIHHDKHHAAYVKNLNDALVGLEQYSNITIEQLLTRLDQLPEVIRTKVRNNGGGHYNHALFWQTMAPQAGGEPGGKLIDAIKTSCGGFVSFQEKFSAAGMGRFGSGWVWLIAEDGKLKIEDSANQDSPFSQGRNPILGLDVWEHAYYLKYQNMRLDYIKAWWNVVNWSEVERRFGEDGT